MATAQDHLYTQEYVETVRKVPIPSQWVADNPKDPNDWTVSFSLPVLPGLDKKGSNFVTTENTLSVFFEDKPVRDPVTRELKEPSVGWKAVMIDPREIEHTGTHLIRVRRHFWGIMPDDREIPSTLTWEPHTPKIPIYVQLDESNKTTRKRMNSLRKMEPGRLADVSNVKQINLNGDETLRELSLGREDDGEEPDEANEYSPTGSPFAIKFIDYANQRSALLGRDIEKMSKYDFFEGLTDPQIDELLASCTKM